MYSIPISTLIAALDSCIRLLPGQFYTFLHNGAAVGKFTDFFAGFSFCTEPKILCLTEIWNGTFRKNPEIISSIAETELCLGYGSGSCYSCYKVPIYWKGYLWCQTRNVFFKSNLSSWEKKLLKIDKLELIDVWWANFSITYVLLHPDLEQVWPEPDSPKGSGSARVRITAFLSINTVLNLSFIVVLHLSHFLPHVNPMLGLRVWAPKW